LEKSGIWDQVNKRGLVEISAEYCTKNVMQKKEWEKRERHKVVLEGKYM
jgi:hypothetical protein